MIRFTLTYEEQPPVIPDFKVTAILDPKRIQTAGWIWKDSKGKNITIRGLKSFPADKKINDLAVQRLEFLLKDKEVHLKDPEKLPDKPDEVICDVYLEGINITTYFPDFKKSSFKSKIYSLFFGF